MRERRLHFGRLPNDKVTPGVTALTRQSHRDRALAALIMLLACGGCPRYRDADVPNAIFEKTDPHTDNPYRLYVPSNYRSDAGWPLIVLCHGTRPWDSADRQMLDWVKLAEEKGFIVAAPELSGTSALGKLPLEKQIARQLEDETRILSAVRNIRGAYNVSHDRVFLTGWSAGSYAVLYTGLRNPRTFRALALQQGNFDSGYLVDLVDRIDPHQPVCVIYGALDLLTGKDAKRCIKWLVKHQANVFRLEVSGGHRGHPEPAQQFFENVLLRVPWLHIRSFAVDGADALTVRFGTRGSFEPETYRWDFGDGQSSAVAEPTHSFGDPGTYQVTLTAVTPKGKPVRRAVELRVPQLHAVSPQRTEWTDSR
ncbi:MAG: PKD domain-containing protein [Phycisphaerae bacterium]